VNIPEEAITRAAHMIAEEHGSTVFESDHVEYEFSDAERDQYIAEATAALGAAAPLIAAPVAGRVVVDTADLETVLNQRDAHAHSRPGIWDDDNRPGLRGTRCVECAARDRLATALRENGRAYSPAEPAASRRPRGGRLPDPGYVGTCGHCNRPRGEHGGVKNLGACPGQSGLYALRFSIRQDGAGRSLTEDAP
jgi:hypothetical protein